MVNVVVAGQECIEGGMMTEYEKDTIRMRVLALIIFAALVLSSFGKEVI